MEKLDQIDLDIIEQLQLDGRKAFTDIARKLDISEGTVRNRVQRLVSKDILQVIGLVDPLQLGYDAPAMIGVSVQPPDLEAAAKTICNFPEVSYLVMVSGEFDLLVEVMCQDRDHLASFLNDQLRQVTGVLRTQTFLILRTYKLSYSAKPASFETEE
jgi:Lrp/AsnC family transcriptional regulator for asnA, asnC and gidA